MTTHEHLVELAGVNLAVRNHVCAFFNTIDEEHRVLGSFYKDGLDRSEKAAHIVDPENREEHLKRLAEAGINAQQAMDTGQLDAAQEKDMIEAALSKSRGQVFGASGAAAILGIPRSTVESKIRSLKINKNHFKRFAATLSRRPCLESVL